MYTYTEVGLNIDVLSFSLQKDKRYLLLDPIADDRARMMRIYIDELNKKGVPPPPTATHPSARYKKD